MTDTRIDDRKTEACRWFAALRDRLCDSFQALEDEAMLRGLVIGKRGRFERSDWQRPGGGGGTMAMMRGRVFEKIGINVSTVWGEFDPAFAERIPGAAKDPRFWAAGLSLVAHPANPLVPAAHMNTRMLVTTRSWFGGGADLTPTVPVEADTEAFHAALAAPCEAWRPGAYGEFKEWCDRYFFLPHRSETRGVGGVFFDEVASGDWDKDFALVRGIGESFLAIYPRLVVRHMAAPFTAADKHAQNRKRGRYVEFNLLHDRGTLFGLKTGGNVEAILMSLPPSAEW
jgi:coproporphyrinogen III oxidase